MEGRMPWTKAEGWEWEPSFNAIPRYATPRSHKKVDLHAGWHHRVEYFCLDMKQQRNRQLRKETSGFACHAEQ
eukprot:s1568_g4.t1